jgi:hypothetical protein
MVTDISEKRSVSIFTVNLNEVKAFTKLNGVTSKKSSVTAMSIRNVIVLSLIRGWYRKRKKEEVKRRENKRRVDEGR